MAALDRYGLTPREYLRREQAILNATVWAERRLTESARKNSALMANVEFVRNNRELVRVQISKYQRSESSPW